MGFRSVSCSFLRCVIGVIFCLITFSGNVYSQGGQFRAGASMTNITPPLGEGIVGNFGVPPPAVHVHDELYARSLVLDDGETKLVFVIVDNVGVGAEVFDEAKKRVNQKTQIPVQQMMFSSTHTHSATSAGGAGEKRRGWNAGKPLDDYQEFLVSRISDAVSIALNNLEPAEVSWGQGKLPQHLFNRRWKLKNPVVNPFGGYDRALMNPGGEDPNLLEPAGPTDPEVSFMSVRSTGGRAIALIANYSLHYVGGLPKDHISADYFGIFADRIQELIKADRQDPPFVGILTNGTSGDVNNVDIKGRRKKLGDYEKMRLVADDLAKEVFRVYQNLEYRSWVPLSAAQAELKLRVRKPDSRSLNYALKVMGKSEGEASAHRLEKTYAERTIQMQEWPDTIGVILQGFKIGNLGIAAIPFEVFTEIGLEIKAKSPLRPTFTISLANGNYGYLPTPAQHKLGGYETWLSTNKVEVDASDKIISEILMLFKKLSINK